MSYYRAPEDQVYFGESAGADRWIEQNVPEAVRASAVSVTGRRATTAAPGVTRYDAPKPPRDSYTWNGQVAEPPAWRF